MQSYMNWSGGKDSAMALYKHLASGKDVSMLLTSLNHVYDRISMHGVRRSMLELQASALDLSLETIELPEQPGMKEYEEIFKEKLSELRSRGYTEAIFGDIFLEDLRVYREQQHSNMQIECSFPLWHQDSNVLLNEFLDLGFKTIVVCINDQYLDKSFCGRVIDDQFIKDLPDGVDPCGENGEFHTFVYDAPIFKNAIPFKKGELTYKKYLPPKQDDECYTYRVQTDPGFYFCDLLPY